MNRAREPYSLTATEALRRIGAGSLSAVEWVVSCRERIRDRLQAFEESDVTTLMVGAANRDELRQAAELVLG